MAFGFAINNPGGVNIVHGSEETYLYWGSKAVTATNNIPVQELPLFNIPEVWNPKVFVTAYNRSQNQMTAGYSSGAWVVAKNGRMYLRTNNTLPGVVTYEAYVFVPAKFIPVPAYGIALYNDKGALAFHNGRYPLMIQELLYSNQGFGTRNFYTAVESRIYNVASIPDVQNNRGFVYTGYLMGEGTGFNVDYVITSTVGNPYPVLPSMGQLAIAVINRDPYWSLPNLGNAP